MVRDPLSRVVHVIAILIYSWRTRCACYSEILRD